MQIIAENCNVYASNDVASDLAAAVAPYPEKSVFLLTDENTKKHCLPLIASVPRINPEHIITIPSGDDFKNAESAIKIWSFLSSHGATRKALLINLGGGMPCDLGGFCAATFKRGIDFINIPTTVLAQVDASLGGKTGMNLGSLKNEVGVFSIAKAVIVSPQFLPSLDEQNLLSGFAEMIKHALIHKRDALEKLLSFDFSSVNYGLLHDYIAESIQIKNHFVTEDPKEQGVRKALNFGHTFGHAFETFAMRHKRPILHGHAVAYGMICELFMSRDKVGLSHSDAQRVASRIAELYGSFNFSEADYPELVELMTHDKKNGSDGINFTLLPHLGDISINHIGTPDEIKCILDEFLQHQRRPV